MNGRAPLPCSVCFDWCFTNLRYKAPKDYPAPTDIEHWDGMLPFKRISFQSLQEAVVTSHRNVRSRSWNTTKAKCFLATEGVSKELAERIIKDAKECSKHWSVEGEADNLLVSRF